MMMSMMDMSQSVRGQEAARCAARLVSSAYLGKSQQRVVVLDAHSLSLLAEWNGPQGLEWLGGE